MRIISFTKKWDKLRQPEFTTFRLPRKDSNKGRDWHKNEVVQVYYHNRCKDREYYGNALICQKIPMRVGVIDDEQAVADGFPNGWCEMFDWLNKAHGGNIKADTIINKLFLRYVTPENKE
jgi:hypothetical protein